MIANPLDLRRHLTEPDNRFDFVPFVDLLLIGLFFALINSRFVFAPGMTIDLPQVDSAAWTGMPTTAVLTVRENDLILFDGQIHQVETLLYQLLAYVTEKKIHGSILLVKVDKNVEMQQVLRICDLARQAGFKSVQIAAEEELPQPDFFNADR